MAMYYKQNNEWKKIFVSREEAPEVSDESIKKHINIDSISLNGKRITPDNLKNVNINAQPLIDRLSVINSEEDFLNMEEGKLYITNIAIDLPESEGSGYSVNVTPGSIIGLYEHSDAEGGVKKHYTGLSTANGAFFDNQYALIDTETKDLIKNYIPTIVGNGLKFADGKLQLNIPVATVSTTYGGDAQ